MKTLIGFVFLLLLSAGTQTVAAPYRINDAAPAHYSFLERLKHAFLPGLQSQSRQTYGYSFTPSEPEANSFRALFKDGHSRVYVTESESLFTVDPHTPSGNLFDFRF
jgi:hypothetical protein